MKDRFKIMSLILALTSLACEKTNDNTSAKLELLQHKWAVVSLSGEALHYTGTTDDYYDFSTNNILYRHVANTFDTSFYQFSVASDNSLLFYPITNGVKSNSAIEFRINNLSATQLILSTSSTNPPIYAIDSLKR